MTRRFWPIAEASQADYERLRDAALAGIPLIGEVAARFDRGGLAGLIASPVARAEFEATLIGARRPPWTPHADPRLQTLANAFDPLLASAESATRDLQGVR
jgi:hypothetical protein